MSVNMLPLINYAVSHPVSKSIKCCLLTVFGAAPYHDVGHGSLSPFIYPLLQLSLPPLVSLLCKQKMREAGSGVIMLVWSG